MIQSYRKIDLEESNMLMQIAIFPLQTTINMIRKLSSTLDHILQRLILYLLLLIISHTYIIDLVVGSSQWY